MGSDGVVSIRLVYSDKGTSKFHPPDLPSMSDALWSAAVRHSFTSFVQKSLA
jgi:hypothetical protein